MIFKEGKSDARLGHFSTVTRYLIGFALFGLALAARFALIGILPSKGFPFLTFFPAVFITAYLAGLGPGLTVSALSILSAWYFFIDPFLSFVVLSRSDLIALIFFGGILVTDCFVIHLMNRALARVRTTSNQLRASEASLKQADQQKDIFLATLAHELRNPIAPIRAAAQLIGSLNVPDEKIRRAGAAIDRQSRLLARLVEDLLDVSRIGSGKLTLRCAKAYLRSVVNTAVETCQPLIEESSHRFHLTMPSEPIAINADEARIAQCISNLLHNAIKFTPRHGNISLTVAPVADNTVSIKIRDDGQGIAPDMIPRLFEMFSQESISGMDGNSGLGIGLALTRRFIEMHDGQVVVRSDGLGKGAEFEILLPRGDVETVPTLAAATELHVQAEALVLVVDDNEDSAEMLKMLLEMEGFRVLAAHDGMSALALIRQYRPQIVLLDIGLPDISGYEVARRARADEQFRPDTLLVALTGWGDDQSRSASASAGIHHHLNKPVDLPLLLGVIREKSVSPAVREG